jgi:hypothetical protein
MTDESIFVQIASYRDPELVPTILDMFDTAHNPEKLNVCICWQHDEFENIDILKSYPNIEIIDVPYYESKGACWARNQIQRRYDGQQYTLQLDSHHRFVDGWDTELKSMYNQCKQKGSEKPLITAYIPAFDPFESKDTYEQVPWKMDFHKFLPDGPVFFVPSPIKDHEFIDSPIPARFYSAHFAFTDGAFSEQVRHDPEFYFYGEEISIAVRAFTHGYDLYHPHKVVCWHEYTRSARFKHWDDHDKTKNDIRGIKQSWWERDVYSQKRNRVLFNMEQDDSVLIKDRYNFGTQRTLQDYERYSGVRFKTKEVSLYTLLGRPAPTPYNENFVPGDDPQSLNIVTVDKNVIVDDTLLKGKNINKIVVEIFDKENRLITTHSFPKEIVSVWTRSPNCVSFYITTEVLFDNQELTYEITTYDLSGREVDKIRKNFET